MLKQLQIRGFKAIDDSGTIVLEPLNVFIGRNGSGKSSVLEFLEVLSNTVESDLLTAAAPFRRGRDLVHNWSEGGQHEASLSLEFDPGDVSAGDKLVYEIGLRTDEAGDQLQICRESLATVSGEDSTDLVVTDDEIRKYRVPPTVAVGVEPRVRPGKRPPRSRREEPWLKMTDTATSALAHLDSAIAPGGAALRTWLESAVFLRLSPTAVADFAPKWRRKGKKALDPLGQQTAELLASMTEDEREAVLEKLKYVTSDFSRIVSHRPSGPGDQRYFLVRERAGGQKVEIPAWVLSEGTRRLTAILAVIMRATPPPLLAIEEVENGFDPWTLQFLLEELAGCTDRGTQVLLTSHSPYLMNRLPRRAFHFVSRDKRGAHFDRITKKNLDESLQSMGAGDIYTSKLLSKSK